MRRFFSGRRSLDGGDVRGFEKFPENGDVPELGRWSWGGVGEGGGGKGARNRKLGAAWDFFGKFVSHSRKKLSDFREQGFAHHVVWSGGFPCDLDDR